MKPFHESMDEYRRQMKKGDIREAYRGLMVYIMRLRSYFEKNHPEFIVSGNIYYGYMDMTYFSLFPKSLKPKNLKIAIVFLHDTCRFEVWLAGTNKHIQTTYWKLVKEHEWKNYRISSPAKGVDSIMEYVVVEHPDFRDFEMLTKQIENGTVQFITDVEYFLSKHEGLR